MKKPSKATITQSAVMRYFHNDKKALEIVLNKPYELFAQESADNIIEMIESEIEE